MPEGARIDGLTIAQTAFRTQTGATILAVRRGGRLDERGSGAGLGLAIVTEIVESWGGTLAFESNNPGLTAIVTLNAKRTA